MAYSIAQTRVSSQANKAESDVRRQKKPFGRAAKELELLHIPNECWLVIVVVRRNKVLVDSFVHDVSRSRCVLIQVGIVIVRETGLRIVKIHHRRLKTYRTGWATAATAASSKLPLHGALKLA